MSRSWDIIERLGALLRAEGRAAGKARGLQPVQIHALAYLARCNRYSDTPTALAEYLGVTKGTASQTVNVLERGGWIAKHLDPDDGRQVRLALTRSGRSLHRQLVPPPRMREALRVGGDVESALEEVLRRVQRARGGRTFGICHTCRFFRRGRGGKRQCGLTGEPLTEADGDKICREHEEASATAGHAQK